MNQEFYDAVQKLVCGAWPGTVAVEIVIKLNSGQKAKLPIPMPAPAFKLSVVSADAFVPNAVQAAVLAALEGKAMKSTALESIVGDKARLFRKPGGLQELREKGLIEHHDRLGYFRPDAPPKEIEA
jgi:hypothetical protein